VLGIDKFEEDIVAKALNSGVIRFVKKPYSIDDINRVYNELNESFLESHRRDFALRFLYTEERIFVMDNSLDDILPITMEIVRGIQYVLGEYENVDDLMVSITEVLRNAIEHGNLNISYKEKQKAVLSGKYEELLEMRSKDKRYKNRKIYIYYKLAANKIIIKIRDEGDGFDWKKMYRQLKKNTKHSHKPTGRGLIIVKMGIDKVFFNDKGNEITLIKYINRNSEAIKDKVKNFIIRSSEVGSK
jgi:anti-sigma regulatory factor (Ser/Thr protein kinase)